MRTKEENAARMRLSYEAQRQANLRCEVGLRDSMTKREYADFLKIYHWDYFLTATFRSPRRDPLPALKNVWHELENYNARRGFLVAEPFQSGDLHVHGIVAGGLPGWKPEIQLPDEIWSGLFKRFGRAKVELCNSHDAVSMYCSKYILKQQSRVSDYYDVFGDGWYWKHGLDYGGIMSV